MSGKGGKRTTSFPSGSSWNLGRTKTIRVPEAIAPAVLAHARALDNGIAVSHGNVADEQDCILSVIAKYIAFKKRIYHANQHSKMLDISTRPWDELRRFQGMVQNCSEELGLKFSQKKISLRQA